MKPPPIHPKNHGRERPLALLYIRVSSDKQRDEGASLPAQRAALIREADRKGFAWEVVDQDAGLSARGMTKRPALQDALARLKAGQADAIWAVAWDRLSRNVRDIADLMARSVDEGWGLWTAREDVNTSSASGRLYVHIMGAVAEFSSAVSSERIKVAMEQRRQEGAVFGRLRDLDEEVRARIIADLNAGLTPSEVCRQLEAEGIPTARGGRWWPGTVRQVGLSADRPAPNGTRKAAVA